MTLGPRTRKTLKILAISYVLKTLLVAAAWLFAPELTDHALATLRATFAAAPAGPSAD
jgi:hypothetical protein